MQVVLLSGRQGSGKSTLQNLLILHSKRAKFSQGVVVNFADTIYRMHHAALEVFARDYGLEETPKKDGKLLQLLGTEWGRTIYGDSVWVKITDFNLEHIQRHDAAFFQNTLVVVGDCRFKNEFDAFPGALRVRLLAPEEERKARTTSWRENTKHPSEVDLDEYELNNKFDLYLRTGGSYGEQLTPSACVELILAQLQKNNWRDKRATS